MTIMLDLPKDLERELSSEAARLGLPLAAYAVRVLAGHRLASPETGTPRTGAELVAYWERAGVLGTRTDVDDPAAYARALRDRAEHRNRS